MDLEAYDYERNSNTITKEERMAFIDRFKRACRAKGLTLQQLQTHIGKTNAYFRNMGYISPKMVAAVKKVIPDLNIEYINKGIGEMFVTPMEAREEEERRKYEVPLLPISARGGTLLGFSEGVNVQECEKIVSPVQDAELAISILGDSMEPEYPSGCIVFIKKVNEKIFIEWGKTYVLDTYNGAVLKNVYPVEGDEAKVACRSINPKYPDYKVNGTDIYGMYKVLAEMMLK